jgi:hypothetical protein
VCKNFDSFNSIGLKIKIARLLMEKWKQKQLERKIHLEKSGLKNVENKIDRLMECFNYERVNKIFETLNNLHGIVALTEINSSWCRHSINIPKQLVKLIRSIDKIKLDPSNSTINWLEEIDAIKTKMRICQMDLDRLKKNIELAHDIFSKNAIPLEILVKLKNTMEFLPCYIRLLEKTWDKKIDGYKKRVEQIKQQQANITITIPMGRNSIPLPPPPPPPLI